MNMQTQISIFIVRTLIAATIVLVQACAIGTASLPNAQEVPASEPLGLDGVWMISGINKKLRFDSGRAVVIDPWIHWGFTVEKNRVALINVRDAGPGLLTADDLVNAGSAWRGVLTPTGRMEVTVETLPLPISYQLVPITMDYPDYINELLVSPDYNATQAARVQTPSAAPAPAPLPEQPTVQAPSSEVEYAPDREPEDPFAGCINLVVDPATNQPVCLD